MSGLATHSAVTTRLHFSFKLDQQTLPFIFPHVIESFLCLIVLYFILILFRPPAPTAARRKCCKRNCLLANMSFPEAKKLVFSCLDVTRNMNKLQKSEYQHALITSCVGGFRQESGYRVGVDHDNQLNDVCKICFCHTYGISESAVD